MNCLGCRGEESQHNEYDPAEKSSETRQFRLNEFWFYFTVFSAHHEQHHVHKLKILRGVLQIQETSILVQISSCAGS